ncbi:2-hydroxyacid dehydrogenase [Emcibacter sp. SYSU 3D8]|uniref:2-hydroxyacid dehydrogenase n=1 Tax=Emcibacter sp. SYSU 3D8 TaxID=3133969 RepID=UPI0031FE99E3
MKAVLQYRASTGFRSQLEAARPDWLSLAIVDEDDRPAFAHEMADADILLHVLEPVTAAVIRAAPRLRLIQKIGVGVNTIDLDAARACGAAVCNMPGSNSQAVAEATLMLMLAALRQAVPFDRRTRDGQGWRMSADVFDRVGELGGRTIGLIGFGAIPQRLAPVLRALGAHVIHTSRTRRHEGWQPLADLLARADVVSLHVPLTDETRRLINADSLGVMKPGAVLVNTARGGLVDEPALIDALRSGRVGAAGLDVFAGEPAPADNPLFALDNVIVSPHVAWLTPETLARSIHVAIENSRLLRDGGTLLNRVV